VSNSDAAAWPGHSSIATSYCSQEARQCPCPVRYATWDADYTDGQEAAAAGKKRMLQGHVPGEPQEKRRKHDERGANPANASGLDTAPAPYPSAAKKPRKERNWCNECNVCFHGIATRLCASCAKENPKLCQKHNAWVKEDL